MATDKSMDTDSMQRQARKAWEAGSEQVQERAEQAWSAGREMAGGALGYGKEWTKAADQAFRDRPITMHVIAVGFGFLLAALLFRRR